MGTSLKSLAGSSKEYWPIQARAGHNSLHIQSAGKKANRDYGIAVDVTAPADLCAWVEAQSKVNSLATHALAYVQMQARVREGQVHVQAKGSKLNRGYGASFSFDDAEMVNFLSLAVNPNQDDEPEEEEEEEEANAQLD